MGAFEIIPFVTESLGDSSYVVISGGAAAVVDPQRDIRPYVAEMEKRGLSLSRAIETHVHNDYISGSPALATLGATVVAPAAAKLEFPHLPVAEGTEIQVGPVRLRAILTPGHTYEHTSYLLMDERGDVAAAFSGGCLIVAGAGRSDLLGAEHTEQLIRMQWESGRRLAGMLTSESRILPTHGAGSFCSSANGPSERTSSLALELARNSTLTDAFEAFRSGQLAGAPPLPAYYRYMAPINRAGDRQSPLPPEPPRLTPGELRELAGTVGVLDLRARSEYAAAHVPGSLAMEECPSLLGYVSWLFPFNAPLALVTYDAHQAGRVTTDLYRIGYERVRGYLPFHVWLEQGHESEGFEIVEPQEARELVKSGDVEVLDVRFTREHREQPLAGARELPIDRIHDWEGEVGDGPVLVACAGGQRATIVASYLALRGKKAIPLIRGGTRELQEATAE